MKYALKFVNRATTKYLSKELAPRSAVVNGVLEPSFGSSGIVIVVLGFPSMMGMHSHYDSVPVHKCLSGQETNVADEHRRDTSDNTPYQYK